MSFAHQLIYKDGTRITTLQTQSRFFWDKNKFSRTIYHPPSNLLEMPINEGFTAATECRAMISKVINTVTKPKYNCKTTSLDSECSKSCCNNVFATEANISRENSDVGETLVNSKEGFTSLVKVKSVHLDSCNALQTSVEIQYGKCVETMSEHMRSPNIPDKRWIPTSLPTYESAAQNFQRKISRRSPRQLTFLLCNRNSWACTIHLFTFHSLSCFVWCSLVSFQSVSPSYERISHCVFRACLDNRTGACGATSRQRWRPAVSSVVKNVTQPGQTIGIDQLVSAQPGLVPQEKGKMTCARIWGAAIFLSTMQPSGWKYVYSRTRLAIQHVEVLIQSIITQTMDVLPRTHSRKTASQRRSR